jgi:hypothetical protein
MRDPLESWRRRHPDADDPKRKRFKYGYGKIFGKVTFIELLVVGAIGTIILSWLAVPIFFIVMYFVSPPVNYADYEAERQHRIEQFEKEKENSF